MCDGGLARLAGLRGSGRSTFCGAAWRLTGRAPCVVDGGRRALLVLSDAIDCAARGTERGTAWRLLKALGLSRAAPRDPP